MATTYKTPGVYLEEITKLPPSVASVATAIPCFFGVTDIAKELLDNDLTGKSKKINSLADYEFYYGFPDIANAAVEVKLNLPADAKLTTDYVNNMYYSVKHYFDNGGGPCYICSVGPYSRTNVDADTYKAALENLAIDDEVTIVVLPDLAGLDDKDKYYDVYNAAMLKASALQDKFVVIDVNIVRKNNTAKSVDIETSKKEFRNVISNNLSSIKYAGAYFPHLETSYSFDFNRASIKMTFQQDVMNANESCKLLNNLKYDTAKKMFAIDAAIKFMNENYFKNIPTASFNTQISEINGKLNPIIPYFSTADQETLTTNAKKLTDQIKIQAEAAKGEAPPKDKFDYKDTVVGKEKATLLKQLQDKTKAIFDAMDAALITDLKNNQAVDNADYAKLDTTFLSKINPFFNSLFEARLKEGFLKIPLKLPPSPAIAGVYGLVDRTRGVWKAPANVSLNAVVKPEAFLSDLDQEDFNVDAENGKSINCIRQFIGRGNLVWGARTLAGNDNEWKYINVRRFFNMVEESCENASRQFVFEPNDANTWVRVKGMIDNYLTNLWRAGALQGAKPEHAFYVSVGLNQTMTADDILNGLLIVEIGLAVVRPAEFIILRFSHKLAVS